MSNGAESSPTSSASPECSASLIDWLKCSVCHQQFSDPWLLRCLHTVCAACYDARVDETRPECPVCLERDVFGHMKVRPDFAARTLLKRIDGHVALGPPLCSGSAGSGGASTANGECSRAAILHCATCSRFVCAACCVQHADLCRSPRLQSAGQAVAVAAAASGDESSGMGVTCWLHPSERMTDYCTACEVSVCAVCVDSGHHPCDHHRLVSLGDQYTADELALFCERVESQMRRVFDMKKTLVRQVRRQCEAHERCARLLDEHHELLVDVLPLEKTQLLHQLDETHRMQKAQLEPFVERALALAADVSHVVTVVERQLHFTTNAEVLALKKPVEARIAALNRKIDEHFSADQPVAQTLMRTGPDMARDMLRVLYRTAQGSARVGCVGRTSPVSTGYGVGLHHHHHHQQQIQQQQQPVVEQLVVGPLGGHAVEMGALNGFGSSTTASDSSHGSSPELSLSDAGRSAVGFDRQLHQHQQQQQQMGFALPSDLSALINDSGVECASSGDAFARPFGGGQSVSSGGSSSSSGGGGGSSRLHALSHITVGLEHALKLSEPTQAISRAGNGTASGGLPAESPVHLAVGGSGGGGGLGQSILNGVSGVERTFNTSFDSGFSGRYSPYSSSAQYGRWSNGTDVAVDALLQPNRPASGLRAVDVSTPTLSPGVVACPARGHVRRQKMIYNVKLGEFGVMEGQFTEPSGVAVNARNEIIVADTNNHRIQVFDREGRFQFSFGECGKREGQLLYPNRVFVNKQSGDIVVTERSPTHQIQIYNQYGAFVRKFGADILQHPRGVTVDSKNRIVVVECKVMRVLIFDYAGEVVKRFGCSRHLEFPNGVAVNDQEEIFISDNRAHCVKVFSYDGVFLRKIGGEGVTNYPIGVGINQMGQVVVADNHNNFNLTVFAQDGQIISALESKVKHAQCFDMALMDGGSVVLASKDYRLYVYRYAPVQGQPPVQQYAVYPY